jgi:hypothetical protein
VLLRFEEIEERLADLRAGHNGKNKKGRKKQGDPADRIGKTCRKASASFDLPRRKFI